MSNANLNGIICELYRSVDKYDDWLAVIEKITKSLNSEKFIFATRDKKTLEINGQFAWNLGDDALEAYLAHYSTVDILSQRLNKLERNCFHSSMNVCTDQELYKSEIYNDFCKPFGIRHSVGVTFENPDSKSYTHFSCLRGQGTRPYNENNVKPWNAIVPHLQQFIYLRQKFKHMEMQARSTEQIVEKMSVAAFLCNINGNIYYHNARGDTLLYGSSLLTSRNDTLVFYKHHHKKRFNELLIHANNAANGKSEFSGGSFRLNQGEEALELRVLPFIYRPEGSHDFNHPCALVLVMNGSSSPVISPRTLVELHNLTIAEAEVAAFMAQGLSQKQIAEKRSTSLQTVQTQIRNIHNKLDTSSQAMLATKILGGITKFDY